jgi:hypothetical protein
MRVSLSTKSRSILIAALLFALLNAIGCSSDSYHYGSDLSQLGRFAIEKNKTTQEEMLAHFGRPGESTSSGSANALTTVMIWTDVRNQEDSNTTITGGDKHSRVRVTTTLRATLVNGVVVDYTTTSSNQSIQQESSGPLGL